MQRDVTVVTVEQTVPSRAHVLKGRNRENPEKEREGERRSSAVPHSQRCSLNNMYFVHNINCI